jgi:hypothetical protein
MAHPYPTAAEAGPRPPYLRPVPGGIGAAPNSTTFAPYAPHNNGVGGPSQSFSGPHVFSQYTQKRRSIWQGVLNWCKDPKSDAQAVGLMITILVGLLGLFVSIVAIIVPASQSNQALVLSNVANAESAENNNYVRLAWCQSADNDMRSKVRWCRENPYPWSFNMSMRPDEELAGGDWPSSWRYLELLSNPERDGLESYLKDQGIDLEATPDAEIALMVIKYLVMSRKAGDSD